MIWVLTLAVVGIAALTIFQAFVLIEGVRQIAQLRERLNMDDKPLFENLHAHSGQPVPASLVPVLGYGTAGDALILFLTSDCTTCRLVASELEGIIESFAERIHIVPIIQARNGEAAIAFLTETGAPRRLFHVDSGAHAGRELDIPTRPLAVATREGRMTAAATIRNGYQLRTFAAQIVSTSAHMKQETVASATASA